MAPQAIDGLRRRAWCALEARALEPNYNLSPHFLLPALRHLDPDAAVRVHMVERVEADGSVRCIGLAAVQPQRGDRLMPLPHLGGYHGRHSFLGHWLLDRDHALEAATALLNLIRREHRQAAALLLPSSPIDGPQWAVMQEAARRNGLQAEHTAVRERAVLVPAQAGDASLKRLMRKQYNNVERSRRRLQEQAPVSWRALRQDIPEDAIDAFLRLEHSGWKGESGTSLRANPAEEAFFREMTAGFAAEGRALFTELRLGDQVIASTCNYVSGDVGFAFKVGWDDSLRKFGIGILNEAEFVRAAPTLCADLSHVDSGSQPASFIEQLWPGRRRMSTIVIPLGLRGHTVWGLRRAVVGLAAQVRAWRQPADDAGASPAVPAASSAATSAAPGSH